MESLPTVLLAIDEYVGLVRGRTTQGLDDVGAALARSVARTPSVLREGLAPVLAVFARLAKLTPSVRDWNGGLDPNEVSRWLYRIGYLLDADGRSAEGDRVRATAPKQGVEAQLEAIGARDMGYALVASGRVAAVPQHAEWVERFRSGSKAELLEGAALGHGRVGKWQEAIRLGRGLSRFSAGTFLEILARDGAPWDVLEAEGLTEGQYPSAVARARLFSSRAALRRGDTAAARATMEPLLQKLEAQRGGGGLEDLLGIGGGDCIELRCAAAASEVIRALAPLQGAKLADALFGQMGRHETYFTLDRFVEAVASLEAAGLTPLTYLRMSASAQSSMFRRDWLLHALLCLAAAKHDQPSAVPLINAAGRSLIRAPDATYRSLGIQNVRSGHALTRGTYRYVDEHGASAELQITEEGGIYDWALGLRLGRDGNGSPVVDSSFRCLRIAPEELWLPDLQARVSMPGGASESLTLSALALEGAPERVRLQMKK